MVYRPDQLKNVPRSMLSVAYLTHFAKILKTYFFQREVLAARSKADYSLSIDSPMALAATISYTGRTQKCC